MKSKLVIGIVILVIVLGIIGFFFTKNSTNANAVNLEGNSVPVKEFVMQSYTEIKDGKYYPTFSLKELAVNKGDKVRIKITNTKGVHDFKIDEFGAYAETPEGKEVVVEFVADKAGSFEYYCTKSGHRQNGQWGTLKVLG